MLQSQPPRVQFKTEKQHRSSAASDLLANARRLANSPKTREDDDSNITRSAKDYATLLETELVPHLLSVIDNISGSLAAQRARVSQCDMGLLAGKESEGSARHAFGERRSAFKACAAAEQSIAGQLAECLGSGRGAGEDACAQLEAARAAKAAECEGARAGVDAAACDVATQAHAACEAYRACRVHPMALYEGVAAKLRDRRVQLHQATQAQCIVHALQTSAADLESMSKKLEQCDAATPSGEDRALAAPPATVCRSAAAYACSGGFLELDVCERNDTWRAPCATCPAMAQHTAPAEEARPPRARGLSSWLPSSTALKAHAWNVLSPRRRSSTAVSLLALGSGTATGPAVNSSGSFASLAVLSLVCVPLVLLAVALFVADTLPALLYGSAASRTPMRPAARRASVPTLKPHQQAPVLAQRRGSAASVDSASTDSAVPPAAASAGSLLPELFVPPGSECVLGIPSLATAAPGEVLLKHITNKSGQALLYAGLTSSPAGGEYVVLVKKDQQELAYCEMGGAVEAEGLAGKIFRSDGVLHARIREATGEETRRFAARPQAPTAAVQHRMFLVSSATGAPWELHVRGDFKERQLTVADASGRQILAMTSPVADLPSAALDGQRPPHDHYKLRLGPNADSCMVIVALLAIERLTAQEE